MLHTLDPFAIEFWSGAGIRWYGLSYLTGFVAAYFVFRSLARRNLTPLPLELISDFVFVVAIGTVIGGRLGYCIFYSPELFLKFTNHIPFWGVLAVNEGGMASHGGIAGIIIASVYFARKHGFSPRHAVDLCALTGPIGVFFGRLANFVNGELVGRPCSEAYSWCVKFPQDIFMWPTQEPERLASLQGVVQELGTNSTQWSTAIANYKFTQSSWQLIDSSLNKIVESVQHGNSRIIELLTPLITLRHPSQLYEAALEGVFLFLVLFFLWSVPRKPGVITGAFLVVYSIVRIVGEQYRMPDAHIGYQALGLTRGQWLSIVMMGLGIVWLAISVCSKTAKIGGWWKKEPQG